MTELFKFGHSTGLRAVLLLFDTNADRLAAGEDEISRIHALGC